MSPKKIVVGGVYVNRGAGKTLRRVIDIIHPGHERYEATVEAGLVPWFSWNDRPADPIVVFYALKHLDGIGREKGFLYLRSFASWAGSTLYNIGDCAEEIQNG